MSIKRKKKIIVAMSGGVDSSVAAKLLIDEGHDVLGIFLSFWKDPKSMGIENKCCSAKALADARAVCAKLNIRLYTLDFAEIFKKEIVDNFLHEYKIGNTPNPCVRCNKFVKIGLLIKKARSLGYEFVATGHYARIKKEKSLFSSNHKTIFKLLKGVDNKKDQSYYLYKFNQKELAHLIFPLGGYAKEEIRALAKKANLPVATKSESQEICFTPNDHNDFLRQYLPLKPGEIRDQDEEIVGGHKGLPLYTVGQRKGIEIGGVGPFYVVNKDKKNNILYITNDEHDEKLFQKEVLIKIVSWINPSVQYPLDCLAVLRYGAKPVKCVVSKKNTDTDQCHVSLSEKARAVTPGQSIVFYKGDEVLGGGVIE